MKITKLNRTTNFYFTSDGSYGHLKADSVVDTKNFTDTDWERIELCCDSERQRLAQFIEEKRGDAKK